MQKYKDSLAAIRQSMQKEPKTMEDLKVVLRAIALVQDSGMAKEISFCDLEERFRCAFQKHYACCLRGQHVQLGAPMSCLSRAICSHEMLYL